MSDIKTYLSLKNDVYLSNAVPQLFPSAMWLGLQPQGTLVCSREVCC